MTYLQSINKYCELIYVKLLTAIYLFLDVLCSLTAKNKLQFIQNCLIICVFLSPQVELLWVSVLQRVSRRSFAERGGWQVRRDDWNPREKEEVKSDIRFSSTRLSPPKKENRPKCAVWLILILSLSLNLSYEFYVIN